MRNAKDQTRLAGATAIACLLMSALTTSAATQSPPLSGDSVREIVLSSTIHLHTPIGTTVPILHKKDGTVTGKAGAVSWFLGASRDKGRWWMTGNKLCHQWKVWFKGKSNCMVIRRRGTKFTWHQDDGENGVVSIVPLRKTTRFANRTINDPAGVKGPLPRQPKATAKARPTTKPAPSRTQTAALTKRTTSSAPTTSAKNVALTRKQPPVAKTKTSALTPAPPIPKAKPGSKAAKRTARQTRQQPTFSVVGVPEHDVLNIRLKPTPESQIVGTLVPNARGVRKAGKCNNGWCPVRHAQKSGWVNRTYLARERRRDSRFRVVNVQTGDVLYIRTHATQAAPIAGTIPPFGKGIKVIGRCKDDWCPVQHARRSGWVNRAFIAPQVRSTSNEN